MQMKSRIKERILQYINIQGISKYEFYKKTGITRGILDKEYGISEENILKYVAYYSEVSLEWLLTGRGPMLRPVGEGERENIFDALQALEETQTVYQEIPDISVRIGELMQKKGFNYRRFSKFLGYADVSIAQIIKGKCKPNVAFLEILLEKIPELNPEWLLTGNGKMFRTADAERKDNSSAPQADQPTEIEVQNQKAIACTSNSKEKDLIIDSLKNQLLEQKKGYERIIREKEGMLQSLETRLADKDKQIESLERQIGDLKNNMERLISEKSEVVKMKDEMLAMKEEAIKGKNEIVRIQSKRISELESHKELEEAKKIYRDLCDNLS